MVNTATPNEGKCRVCDKSWLETRIYKMADIEVCLEHIALVAHFLDRCAARVPRMKARCQTE